MNFIISSAIVCLCIYYNDSLTFILLELFNSTIYIYNKYLQNIFRMNNKILLIDSFVYHHLNILIGLDIWKILSSSLVIFHAKQVPNSNFSKQVRIVQGSNRLDVWLSCVYFTILSSHLWDLLFTYLYFQIDMDLNNTKSKKAKRKGVQDKVIASSILNNHE